MKLVEKLREYAAANICRDGDDMDCPCRCGDEMKEAADRIEALEEAIRWINGAVASAEGIGIRRLCSGLMPDDVMGLVNEVLEAPGKLTSHLPSAESEQSAPPER